VQRQPASSTDHNNIGSVLAQLGRMREARAEFERALQLDPAALTRERILRGRKRNRSGKIATDPGPAGALAINVPPAIREFH
jgi:predicted RNA polymerase sigma factor